MKSKRIFITLTLLSTLFMAAFRISEPFLDLLNAKLKTFNQTYQEEKVYLQFDKTLYKPGDNIWFNAFVLNAGSLKPSEVSDVLYIELIDSRGTVVQKLELFIEEGTAHGDFELAKTAPGGLYKIKAYTLWMLNFESKSHFLKDLMVQSLITPRMLLTLDFEKRAYGPGETVTANLKAKDLKNEFANGADVSGELKIGGKTFSSKTFHVDENGQAKLLFVLPDSLNTNDGLLLALVRYQGVEESISRSVPIVLNKIDLKFFPESGDLLAGNKQRVAFKATNEFGKGVDVSGEIVDENNARIATFESFHFGMGSVTIPVDVGKKYFARINSPIRIDQLFALPESKETGYGFSVDHTSDTSLQVSIFSRTSSTGYLVGRVRDEIQYAKKIDLKDGETKVPISINHMPAGVLTLTVFDGEGVEQAERLTYIHYHQNLNISIATDKKQYEPGERVEATIKTLDAKGKPVPARMSLAVVDNQLLTAVDDKQDNLLTWMLLGSDVRGKVDEPSFYFNPNEPKAQAALDYLLMVHGWRRFTWKEVLEKGKVITYLPENLSTLSGLAFNKNLIPSQAEVTLMELNNRRRLVKVMPTTRGQFVFKNVDASAQMLLLVKSPNTIEVDGRKSYSVSANTWYRVDSGDRYPWITKADQQEWQVDTPGTVEVTPEGEMDVAMAGDAAQLSEIIVVGYGTTQKKDLTASVITVISQELEGKLAFPSIANVLGGRASGINIVQGAPGAGNRVLVRGLSSLNNNSQPLWVIDGIPLSDFGNKNFQSSELVGMENIASIYVMKSAEASSLFGSAGSNGAILIETKNKFLPSMLRSEPRKPRYTVLQLEPRKFSPVREFYRGNESQSDTRKDFNPTIFWHHTVVTDKNGEAKITFNNSGATSAFRITAEGITGNGIIGRKETTYFTQLPFSLDAKIPEQLGFEDTLRLPVRIVNNTDKKQQALLTLKFPKGFRALNGLKHEVEVGAHQSKNVPVVLVPDGLAGLIPITIKLESNRYSDEIKRNIQVSPVGFPVRYSYSGHDLSKTLNIEMKDIERGSIKGEVIAVTNLLEDIFTSVESMLHEPSGCFEQVSSSTFPNIIVLQLLQESGRDNPAIRQKALNYIDHGYKKLIGYEVKGGGFEWFGRPPAHTALTAYGLLEFTEMKKVYSEVDDEMVRRTTQWLLGRRRGDGTFNTSNEGYDGFSSAPANVTNAYLVYVFSETGVKGIDLEYQRALNESLNSKDLYRAGLMANAALNTNQLADYEQLKSVFLTSLKKNGLAALNAESSITRSYGQSLQTEMLALWALALMKEKTPDFAVIKTLVEYIGSKKSFGMYGSTQATCLSLKAVTEYIKLVKQNQTGGLMHIAHRGTSTDQIQYVGNERNNLTLTNFSNSLSEGNNLLTVQFTNTSEALPYSVNIQWNTKTPQSSPECKLLIETSLNQQSTKANQTVRLKARLVNKTEEHLPMSMAVIGIPAGLSLQPWQLKELVDKNLVDFYEIRGHNLVLYYRTMTPTERKEINLDLKADIPGKFQAGASCAYLYYTDEFKTWIRGEKILIMD